MRLFCLRVDNVVFNVTRQSLYLERGFETTETPSCKLLHRLAFEDDEDEDEDEDDDDEEEEEREEGEEEGGEGV